MREVLCSAVCTFIVCVLILSITCDTRGLTPQGNLSHCGISYSFTHFRVSSLKGFHVCVWNCLGSLKLIERFLPRTEMREV